jgi:AcrR family transcriptional regulator
MHDAGGPKERILDAAEGVFAERGYRGGSLNDIAVSAGYTRAGLLHHFPNKEAVLLAILERRDDRLRVAEFAEGARDVDELMARIDEQVTDLMSIRPLVRLGHLLEAEAASTEHPAHEWAASRESRLRALSAGVVARAQREGRVREDVDPDVVAATILATLEGLESQWLLDETVDVAAGMRFLRLLLRGIATDDAS